MKKLIATGAILLMTSPLYCQKQENKLDLIIKKKLAQEVYDYLMKQPVREVLNYILLFNKMKLISTTKEKVPERAKRDE